MLICSCSKKEEPLLYSQVYDPARAYDSTLYEIIIMDNNKRIICENYGEGCTDNTGKRWMVRSLELPIIGFVDEDHAKAEALRLNQFHYKNWLFDEVRDEPVLETFLFDVYGIKSARETESLKKSSKN